MCLISGLLIEIKIFDIKIIQISGKNRNKVPSNARVHAKTYDSLCPLALTSLFE